MYIKKINKWIQQPKNNYVNLFLTLFGLTLPFLFLTFIDVYFQKDVETFNAWTSCWSEKIYIDCKIDTEHYPYPNYPAIGLILSAGVFRAISSISGNEDLNTLTSYFRYYLAFFDALNFLLLISLAKLLNFRFPVLIALILLIVPSTWVGGAIWGQIDNISLFFGLFSSICFFKSWSLNKVWKNGIWLLLGSLNLCLYLLTKQLAIFSIPFFFLLLGITIYKFLKYFNRLGLFWLIGSLIFFILCFRYLDGLFEVPSQFYNSSYLFVWLGGGSSHGDQISGNGFNIWMFLGRDMHSSSSVPFFTWQIGNFKEEMNPHQGGIVLYALCLFFLLFTCLREIYLVVIRRRETPSVYLIALLCLFHGLSHLAFNVFLTGTHERYLYLGYPFLLITAIWFYVNHIVFSWQSTIFCVFAAIVYGCFVYSILAQLPGLLFAFQRHEFLASLHLFLLIVLLDLWVKICYSSKNNLS